MAAPGVCWTLCCAILCATLAAHKPFAQGSPQKRTLQQEETYNVTITSENVQQLETWVHSAARGTVFFFESGLVLPGRITVNVSRLSFRGTEDDHPTIRCAKGEGAFRIRANNVMFEDLTIRDCGQTAVVVPNVTNDLFNSSSGQEEPRLRVTFRRVHFVDNVAGNDSTSAGAIAAGRGVVARVSECQFVKNKGRKGGAIHHTGISLIVRDSSFVKNTAEEGGGAIFFDDPQSPGAPAGNISIESCSFSKNSVLRGNESKSDIASIETSPTVQFSNPSPSGGAVYASGVEIVKIIASNFSHNNAIAAGGALHMTENLAIAVDKCRFRHNHLRQSDQTLPSDLQQGGAVFLSQSNEAFKLKVSDSSFVKNNASYGGALHFVGHEEADFKVSNSHFRHNHAASGGGAILSRNVRPLDLHGVGFLNNTAGSQGGGAILVTNGGGLEVKLEGSDGRRSSFHANRATRGGAIFGRGATSMLFAGAVFNSNRADGNGGALCVDEAPLSSELQVKDSQFVNNRAGQGGAIFLVGVQNVIVNGDRPAGGQSTFSGNAAVEGGGIYYVSAHAERNALRIEATSFSNNRAFPSSDSLEAAFEGIATPAERFSETSRQRTQHGGSRQNELLNIRSERPCVFGGGGAICAVLYKVSYTAEVFVEISNNTFTENSAEVGGAMVVAMDPGKTWTRNCPPNNESAPSTSYEKLCRRVTLQQTRFEGNRASAAGGGIAATNVGHLFPLTAQDLPQPDEKQLPLNQTGNQFVNNSFTRTTGYGHDVAGAGIKLSIKLPEKDPTTGLTLVNESGGLLRPLPSIAIQKTDALNQVVTDGITDSSFQVCVKLLTPCDSCELSGQELSNSEEGVANFSALYLKAKPGQYELEFSSSDSAAAKVQASVTLRDCSLGETFSTERFSCEGCPFESFTFYSNTSCNKCEDNARCEGNASLVPLPGYWHSNPFSLIMHACICKEACTYTNRSIKLQTARDEWLNGTPGMLDQETALTILDGVYNQCTTGYEGPICGSCARGYGRASSNECQKCNSIYVSVVIFVLLALWQLTLLLMTTRSALVSVHDMAQMAAVLRRQSVIAAREPFGSSLRLRREHRIGSEEIMDEPEDNTPQGRNSDSGHRQRRTTHESETLAAWDETGEDVAYTAEYVVETQHLSETMKIIINFLQITSVVASIDLNWTFSLKKLLESLGSAAGLSGATSFSSSVCILDFVHDDRAIYDVVVRTALPVVLLLLLLSGFVFQWLRTRRTSSMSPAEQRTLFKSRIIVGFLVTSFFAYQSFSESFIGIFSCIEIDSKELSRVERDYDDEVKGAYYSNYSIARGNYWTIDTTVECFKGNHAYLTGFLGVPGVLFLGAVPVYLLVFLLYSRQNDKLKDLAVLNTHGFIYQNYKDDFVFWEVFILVRKALIAVVIVFAYPLGANLQATLALGVLIIAGLLHTLAHPFKYRSLNLLEGFSLNVSICTLLIGLVFNDTNTSHAAFVLLSVVLVCINAFLVFTFIYALLFFIDKFVAAKMKSIGVLEIPENPFFRVLRFTSVHFDKAVEFVRTSATQASRDRETGHPATRSGNPALPEEFAV